MPARISYDAPTRTATLYPLVRLAPGVAHTVRVDTTVRAVDEAPLASDYSSAFTVMTAACPCRLFSQWKEPAVSNLDTRDARPEPGPWTYELGVKVLVQQATQLSAIRFWKSSLETGTHIGRVWTAAGLQLAQVTFTNETASGWQEQRFATPLALEANATYVVSVNANVVYALTAGTSRQDPRRSVELRRRRPNGVSGSAAGVFPGTSFNSSNYFVDVEVGGGVAPDTTPPGPVSNFVAALGATSVALTWQSPSAPDLSHVRIVRKAGSAPAGPTDGTVLCDCTGQSATDSRPADGVTYHYAAYAYDQSGNASSVARAQVTAVAPDTTPPGPVSNFVASLGATSVALTWQSRRLHGSLSRPDGARRAVRRLGRRMAPSSVMGGEGGT